MILDSIQSTSDVEECVELYYNIIDKDFFQVDRTECIKRFNDAARRKRFIRIIRLNSRIIAWIYADLTKLFHSSTPKFQQMYFITSRSGISAYRCIVLLHEEMYEFSKSTSADYCLSPGGPHDSNNVIARSLEKNGWIRKGYAAIRRIER